MPQKVKILSSWSNPGGSTISFIRLCNLFNDKGYDATFYGQHDWHLDKCKSDKLDQYNPEDNDIIISHMLTIGTNVPRKRHILSLHETNLFPLTVARDNGYLESWDAIHYVSSSQRAWHAVNHPYRIIPNIIEDIENISDCHEGFIAGVIGSIDKHKQTHLSIQRALADGADKVLVFGNVTDIPYSIDQKEWIYHDKVQLMGHYDNQRDMYAMVDKVYHSSQRETFNYIAAECSMLGIPYDGLESAASDGEYLDKEEIFERWTQLLEL